MTSLTDSPLVEWGILLYPKKTGQNRYPSEDWVKKFHRYKPSFVRSAAHLCGQAVEKFLDPHPSWDQYRLLSQFDRVQLNMEYTNTSKMKSDFIQSVRAFHEFDTDYDDGNSTIPVIVQNNLKNKPLILEILENCAVILEPIDILFDESKGKGKTPQTLATPPKEHIMRFTWGYAGGITEENVVHTLNTINQKVHDHANIWIDLETGARNSKNKFDLDKVTRILEKVQQWHESDHVSSN